MSETPAVEQLTDLLSSLKSKLNGGELSADYWLGRELGVSEEYILPTYNAEEIFRSARLLKDLRDTLESLKVDVERGHERLLRSSLHHGLELLPDDILIYIIDILGADSEDAWGRPQKDSLIRQLSSVSRRFRAAVLNTVSLWTKIDKSYCLDEGFETRIARTQNALLSLDITPATAEEVEKMITMTQSMKERWQHLKVEKYGITHIVTSNSSGMDFPRLESLYLSVADSEDSDAFFDSWTFPKLKSLTMSNALPPPGRFVEMTDFEFKYARYTNDERSRYQNDFEGFYSKLMRFLKSTPSLQKLSIDVSTIGNASRMEFSVVTLPGLEMLSISNYEAAQEYSADRVSADTLGRIMRSLRIPSGCNIHLGVYFSGLESVTDWLSSYPSPMVYFRSIASLALGANFCPNEEELSHFFTHFRSIEKLEVDVAGFATTVVSGVLDMKLDRLRSLILPEIVEHNFDWDQYLCQFTSCPEKVRLSLMRGEQYAFHDYDADNETSNYDYYAD